ncbi:MAG: hypothetical protein ABH829_02475 [archaeon]
MEKYRHKKPNRLVELIPDSTAFYLIIAIVAVLSLTTILSFAIEFIQPIVRKVSVLAMLMAFTALLRYPERYKAPFSFNVAMAFTILVTISDGIIAGMIFGTILSFVECRTTLHYNSLPITMFERWLCAVLAAVFYAGGGVVFYPVIFIALTHLVSIPIRMTIGDAPIPLMLVYAAFNTLWQGWFLSVLGSTFLALI